MNKILKVNLADFLKDKRIESGFSQKNISDKLGYSTPQFISNWERGLSQPPISSLKKIADVYKTSADELFEIYLEQTIQDITADLRRKFASSRK